MSTIFTWHGASVWFAFVSSSNLFLFSISFSLSFSFVLFCPTQSLIDRLPAADRAAWHRAIRACVALLLKQHAGLARRVFRSFAVDEWALRAQQQQQVSICVRYNFGV